MKEAPKLSYFILRKRKAFFLLCAEKVVTLRRIRKTENESTGSQK
ncbi:hypothetical protein HMPREF1981_01843 [Bacteroides pyogenes F0041]|uniref:Uncharacterized protein n=1 Tax=Bacteroides pyogenes F0041 TaxID=1321819 RepID=U2DZC6_9BACE|nr:hypothetical protein HMPREF1981_01843 [Bacteroides pyogenes F0041]